MNIIYKHTKYLDKNRSNYPLDRIHRFYIWVFIIFIGFGPVYWLPFIPISLIQNIKIVFYLLIIIPPIIWELNKGSINFPGGEKLIYLFSVFIMLSIPAIIKGDVYSGIYRFQSIFQVIFFINAVGYIIYLEVVEDVIRKGLMVFIVFSTLSIVLTFIIPSHQNPFNAGLSLLETGLGGSRTGWSPSMAVYLPWLYSGHIFNAAFSIFATIILLSNQVLVSGRTGLIGSLIPFLLWGVLSKSIKKIMIVVTFIVIATIYTLNSLDYLRLNITNLQDFSSFDEFSSGRIEQYPAALDAFLSKPLLGYGVDVVKLGASRLAMHNEIVKLALEGGIFYAASAICILIYAIKLGFRNFSKQDSVKATSVLTVIAGIVASMFEPEIMFGSFNKAAFWWVCFSICVSNKKTFSFVKFR